MLFTKQSVFLPKLIAALQGVLPRIANDVPRDEGGEVLDRAMTDAEFAAYSGILAHWHITRRKIDPGPAFDWDRLLSDIRRWSR